LQEQSNDSPNHGSNSRAKLTKDRLFFAQPILDQNGKVTQFVLQKSRWDGMGLDGNQVFSKVFRRIRNTKAANSQQPTAD
jgi:hypothetical protein